MNVFMSNYRARKLLKLYQTKNAQTFRNDPNNVAFFHSTF